MKKNKHKYQGRITLECLTTHKVHPVEFIIEKAITFISFLSLAFIILIFIFVFREAGGLFFHSAEELNVTELDLEMETYGEEYVNDNIDKDLSSVVEAESEDHSVSFLDVFGLTWQPVSLNPRFGIIPLFVGSLKIALIAIALGAPLAIFGALYTSIFAPPWVRETIKPGIEILAGFPSVVIGFFALVILASAVQKTFGFQFRLNSVVGGIALSLAVIPIIYTISEDALNAVPRSLTQASLALGARKWQTALFVVMPAAIPGIFASILLGIGRAVGETMIALMATGNAAILSLNPALPVRTMAATIGAEMAEVVFGDTHYSVLFFLGVLLFIFSFILNSTTEFFIRQRLMKRFGAL
ncbi:MAG: phosphate ABC transporter permease subunit PstC [Chitinivibrionales bacterium]|nr:phosphate ABC transporter permease subunit PstC [Chitinivibrionales bacterium]